MTDAPTTPPNDQGSGQQPAMPSLRILAQYVKDLSFENPGAPDTLRGGGQAPNIDLMIDVRARSVQENTFEVTLHIEAKAQRNEDEVVFLAELAYAGLFQLDNVSEQDREPFLLIECPRLIFPFARRILADTSRDGGFPPLMVDPVDFAGLYRQQLAKRQQAAQTPSSDSEQ